MKTNPIDNKLNHTKCYLFYLFKITMGGTISPLSSAWDVGNNVAPRMQAMLTTRQALFVSIVVLL
eukprot:m.25048 g.25048  ORF g.25048 m.25048 type:complete len:65 (-) comp7669_c0_seq2:24-218(-)